MCFGHAPHLDQLIAQLTGARSTFTELKKSGVACFEMESTNAAKSVLRWILPPKVLRSLC